MIRPYDLLSFAIVCAGLYQILWWLSAGGRCAMSDMIDLFRAQKAQRRDDRESGWHNREVNWGRPLREAGFTPFTVSEHGRHCRVRFKGGWFDFWPSSGKWMCSPLSGGRRAPRGHGVESLIAELNKATSK